MKQSSRLIFFIALCFIYSCTSKQENGKTSETILNTSAMKEYPIKLSDSTINILEVVSVYPSDKKKPNNNSIPNADVFLCRLLIRPDTVLSHADTVAVLDTDLRGSIDNIILKNYWANVVASAKFKSCKVKLSQKDFENLKNHKYQYATVTMVTDD